MKLLKWLGRMLVSFVVSLCGINIFTAVILPVLAMVFTYTAIESPTNIGSAVYGVIAMACLLAALLMTLPELHKQSVEAQERERFDSLDSDDESAAGRCKHQCPVGRVHRRAQPVAVSQKHPGSVWIDEHMAELPRGHWVAADGSGLVAFDLTNPGLMDKLIQAKVASASLAIAFIPESDGPELRRQTPS